MNSQIRQGLREIALAKGVRILYACESGSRAWGIESPDSDWDVRFVYAHPRNWYLTIHEGRDVIERMDGDLDYSGWDIRKALCLAYKSNPSLLEWLHSPIVYEVSDRFQSRLTNLLREFSAAALMHHYLSLASRQVKAYWNDSRLDCGNAPVTLKKYLYAVRPVMAVQWMADNGHRMPPIEFADILQSVPLPPMADAEMKDLLTRKAHSAEKMGQGRFPALDAYINEGIESGRILADAAPTGQIDARLLDTLFQQIIAP